EIVRAANVMKSQIKLAEEMIMPEVAHLPNMEKPQLFNEAVMTFLRENLV
ncbi:MAG: alpha/beta hydrolase, partial [Chitinophagaceae bacterium]|nr:alpha/beta hydrolase [Anaerolineae bacterium]